VWALVTAVGWRLRATIPGLILAGRRPRRRESATRREEESLTARKRSALVVVGVLVTALALVAAGCGGGDDDGGQTLKIVSDLPLQGSNLVQTGQMVEAMEYVLRQADNKAGDYSIEYESKDDAIAATGDWDEATCAANAREYVDDESIVINIGTYNSGCAAIEIPILNEAGLAMVSPANTYAGLTHSAPGTEPGEPAKYYPTGTRTYTRVVASDDFQGKAGAQFMKNELGVKSVFILDDKQLYGKGVADAFQNAAEEIGLDVAGHEGWDAQAPNYTALMTKIKATGADGIYIGGLEAQNGSQVVKDKVAVLGDNETVKLVMADGMVTTALIDNAGQDTVEGAYGTAPTLPYENLTGAGKEFIDGFQEEIGDEPIEVYTIYAATAMQVALDAIARSDGTREGVLKAMFETDLSDTVVGQMSFDENGDPAGGSEQLFKFTSGEIVWQKQLEIVTQ
jgi:branched-chain amino acid transport system substrate-binding protein